jgi:hypothetical protein
MDNLLLAFLLAELLHKKKKALTTYSVIAKRSRKISVLNFNSIPH